MAHRTYVTMIGLIGVVLVAALLLAGASLARHAQQGPAWKRRLVGAGIMLLSALGLAPTAAGCSTSSGARGHGDSTVPQGGSATQVQAGSGAQPVVGEPPGKAPSEGGYVDTPEWRQIVQAATDAEPIASGSRGEYPFDRAGQQRLLGELAQAVAGADRLAARGLLAEGEAGLLKMDLGLLADGVSALRPTEMINADCYEPLPMVIPAQDSLARLEQRLPFLEKVASAQTLHPAVVEKVLAKVEHDLTVLGWPDEIARIPSVERQQAARQVAERARGEVDRIRARLGTPSAPVVR